jgi:hypothetical protein
MVPKRHPRRKPIEGLTPEAVISDMFKEAKRGRKVRKVQPDDGRSNGPVLPPARPQGVETPSEGGVSPAAEGDDSGRASDARKGSVSDVVRQDPRTQLSSILKRMLGEQVPQELLDLSGIKTTGDIATCGEALGAIIMRQALEGRQWAVEIIRDQTEGKPVRAAQVSKDDGEVEQMLDRVSMKRLDKLVKGK